jgi:hypothetical protein
LQVLFRDKPFSTLIIVLDRQNVHALPHLAEYAHAVFKVRGMKKGRRSSAHAAAALHKYPYPASFYMDAYRSYQMAAAAIESGCVMGEKERSTARVRLFEQRSRAKWALASHGAESLPFAVQMLFSFDPEERDDGRVILGLIGSDDDAVDQIASLMQGCEDPRMRQVLISLLGEKRNGRAVPHLTALLVDPSIDPETREATMSALGLLTPSGAESEGESASDVRVEMEDWIAGHRGSRTLEQEAQSAIPAQGYGTAAV